MLDKDTKAAMEQDLQTNFRNITLTVPPDNTQNIRFDMTRYIRAKKYLSGVRRISQILKILD